MKSKYPPLIRSAPIINGRERDVWFELDEPEAYLHARVDHTGSQDNGVRIFTTSPESMTIQIRTYGSTASGRAGKKRAVYSQFTYNRQSMLTIAAEIERVAKLLPEA